MYCIYYLLHFLKTLLVVMGGTLAPFFFKPEQNLEFFRLKNGAIDATLVSLSD